MSNYQTADREGHGLGYTVPQLEQALYERTARIKNLETENERLQAALADVATSSDGQQFCWCPESKPLTADHMPACRRARKALA